MWVTEHCVCWFFNVFLITKLIYANYFLKLCVHTKEKDFNSFIEAVVSCILTRLSNGFVTLSFVSYSSCFSEFYSSEILVQYCPCVFVFFSISLSFAVFLLMHLWWGVISPQPVFTKGYNKWIVPGPSLVTWLGGSNTSHLQIKLQFPVSLDEITP